MNGVVLTAICMAPQGASMEEVFAKSRVHQLDKRKFRTYNKNKGVIVMAGYSKSRMMSNNAVSAYAKGEKPWKKWKRKDIIAGLREIGITVSPIFSTEQLRERYLVFTCEHHVGKIFKRVKFYKIRE